MRSISSDFKNEQDSGNRNYLKYADVTLTDGTVFNFTNEELWQNGLSFESDTSNSGSFDIGSAMISKLTLQINNFDGTYSKYDFNNAKVVAYVGLQLTDRIEKIKICTATVTDAPYQNNVILSLTCEDNMAKFDRDYSESKLIYPATRLQIVQDICSVCGVSLQTTTFTNSDYIVPERPDDENLTCRQVLAWVAQIGCQWAKCDADGKLNIGWYKTEPLDSDYISIEHTNGFTPYLDDVVITGIQVIEYLKSNSSEKKAKSYLYGKTGYVLSISDNKLIPEGTGETVASMIGQKCIGMSFRPFTAQCLTDISLEEGDPVKVISRDGTEYKSYLTSVRLQPGTFEDISCEAKSPARNSRKQYSLLSQAMVEARQSVHQEKTARELAIEQLGQKIEESSGVYTTVVKPETGGNIYYLHNRPKLEDSDMVWKMTAEAWGVSTSKDSNGNFIWNAGMTVDGDTIVRILTATGVNADWINAGEILVKDNDGNTIFSVNMDTKSVYIDGSSVTIGGKPLEQALSELDSKISESLPIAMSLTCDFKGITVDADGNYETFPDGISTSPIVVLGAQDITADCAYTITKSDSITGTWSNTTRTYTVTGLTADDGWVDIRATYLTNIVITKRFSVSKVYNGQSGATYGLMTSSPIIKKTSQSELTPTYVDFTAYYTVGKDITKYYLNGRFVIEEVLNDDGVWRMVYTSTQDESEVRRSLYTVLTTKDGKVPVTKDGKYALGYPRNVTSIRCRFYAAGGTTQLLGEQTCAVVADATAQLSQSDIVEILNDGGRWNGLYYKNGKLYISFSAALGGELTLGGEGNGNGKLVIRDSSGKQIGYIDNTGVNFEKGKFSGSLEAATGTFTGELVFPTGNMGGWKISNNPQCIYSGDKPGDPGITLYASGRVLVQYIDTSSGVAEAETALDVLDGRIYTYQQTLDYATLNNATLNNAILDSPTLNSPTGEIAGFIIDDDNKCLYANVNGNRLLSFNASDGTIAQAYWYGSTVPSATYKALDTSSGRAEMYAPKIYGGQFDGSSVGGSDDELVLNHANINNAYIDNATLTGCDLSNPTRLLNPPTVSSGGHIVFAADGMTLAYLGSSSKRYKNHVKDISDEDVQKLFEIPVVYFKYKPGYLEEDDSKVDTPIPGFYAEDMEQAFPDAVRYEDGKAEDWNYRTLIPAMEKQIQILYKQNQEFMKSIKELKEAQNNGNKL